MCSPTLAVAAVAGTEQAASMVGQAQASDRQMTYQNGLAIQTQHNADQAAVNDYSQVALQEQQRHAKLSQDTMNNNIRALQAEGTAQAAGAEGGVGGNSVDALMQEYQRQRVAYNQTLKRNNAMQNQQDRMTERGIQSRAQSRINKATPGPMKQPDYLGAALRVGAAAGGQYAKEQGWIH